MSGRVITTRPSTQRTRTTPQQQALRPVNHGNPGERVFGDISREEARHQQTLKYREDSKKFVEKEKQKEQKKKEEKWKRYSHVDVGHRFNSDNQELKNDVRSIRERQQLAYDLQALEGLDLERERQIARVKRDERRKEDKLKKHDHIRSGQRLGSAELAGSSCSEEAVPVRPPLQSDYETHSVQGRKQERQRSNRDIDVNSLEHQVNYNRAVEEKARQYQSQKLKTESSSPNFASSSGSSHSLMNNLNATDESESEAVTAISSADRDKEYRESMRLARERLQKRYDEELRKSS